MHIVLVCAAAACLASTQAIAAPAEPGHLVISGGPILAPEGDRRFDDLARMFVPGALVAFDRQSVDRQGTVTIEQFLQGARDRAERQPPFREWLTGEATVLVDGAIAVVWAPFIVEVGSTRATGTDVFKLVKLDGRWRISGLSFTNRPL